MRVETNKTMFGKRNPEFPYKAVIDDNGSTETIAVGETVAKAKENGEARLLESFHAMQMPMEVRIAKDGTVYAARWTGPGWMEYWIYRNGERGGGCMGRCTTSLAKHMDMEVERYNACCDDPELVARVHN